MVSREPEVGFLRGSVAVGAILAPAFVLAVLLSRNPKPRERE